MSAWVLVNKDVRDISLSEQPSRIYIPNIAISHIDSIVHQFTDIKLVRTSPSYNLTEHNTGKLTSTTRSAHVSPTIPPVRPSHCVRLRNILYLPSRFPGTLRRCTQGLVGSASRRYSLHSCGLGRLRLRIARPHVERSLPHPGRVLIRPPCLDQEHRLQQIALHMPFRNCLPFFFRIGLLCGTLYLLVQAFLGHCGIWVKASLLVLLLCFVGDCIALILELKDRVIREAGRIYNRL